jgi:hypothetical protein
MWAVEKIAPLKRLSMKETRSVLLIGIFFFLVACGGSDEPAPIEDATTVEDESTVDALPEETSSSDEGTVEDACAEPDTGTVETPPGEEPVSSAYFLNHVKPMQIPGRFPASPCDDLKFHHECVSTAGCNWLRTIKNNGVCRADPVARCLSSGECVCTADNFHGVADYDDDLEIFVPLSVGWQNLASRTSSYGGGEDRYSTSIEMEEIVNESLLNFTSRTDFTHKTLTVTAPGFQSLVDLMNSDGLTLTMKFMNVWDYVTLQTTPTIDGVLFEGLGIQVSLEESQVSLKILGTDVVHSIAGENPFTGGSKDYQCNQFALVIPENGDEDEDAIVYLGAQATTIPGLNMDTVLGHLLNAEMPVELFRIGAVKAKVWDLRLYSQGRQLSAEEVGEIGKRCGTAGDYAIPEGYPDSNPRYSWGMGGSNIVFNHAQQHFSSGVYVTMWVPEPDTFPPLDTVYRDDLNRMIGFWDRWHEQMFFEFDLIPFIDTRELLPEGSLNSYRDYPQPLCPGPEHCGEATNYNNPCRYVTDLFQAFNWLPEDFPDEPTSADHRKIAQNGGFTRWASHDPDLYTPWQRPVHEHGHTAHFTLMRTYYKVHHYIRGISGESFAEIMTFYVLTGVKSWMSQGLLYYPTIPISFEGRWDSIDEKHVFKSSQPYQELNIDDQGLGARFYGLGVWWTFVAHYAAKPYIVGWISGDTDFTPGTTIQKMRFYLAQEGLDLGELFGNYAAHVATWDWPYLGHHYYEVEQDPFQGIEKWCTQNSGPECTIDGLKVQADVDPEAGTNGEWVDSPEGRDPGGFAFSTIRIASAPAGAIYEFGLEFVVPTRLYSGTNYQIGLPSYCRNDPRFFSSRIVVVDAGTEGQEEREHRPEYYKIPGRLVESVIVRVPEGQDANIYLLAIPTPPFELEDVSSFVDGHSLTWPFRYKVTRHAELPECTKLEAPIILKGDETLSLTPQEGNGFVYDCFGN